MLLYSFSQFSSCFCLPYTYFFLLILFIYFRFSLLHPLISIFLQSPFLEFFCFSLLLLPIFLLFLLTIFHFTHIFLPLLKGFFSLPLLISTCLPSSPYPASSNELLFFLSFFYSYLSILISPLIPPCLSLSSSSPPFVYFLISHSTVTSNVFLMAHPFSPFASPENLLFKTQVTEDIKTKSKGH